MTTTREASPTLRSLVQPNLIFPGLAGSDRASVLRELALRLAEGAVVTDGEALYRLLEEREELGSTGIGSGVAVPHCKVKGLRQVILAVGIAANAIDFDSADGEPVRVFFVLLSPHHQPAAHLQSLAAISHWVQGGGRLDRLLACRDGDDVFATLTADEDGD